MEVLDRALLFRSALKNTINNHMWSYFMVYTAEMG